MTLAWPNANWAGFLAPLFAVEIVHNIHKLIFRFHREGRMTNSALSSTPRRELTEDWLAVWVGLLIFALALAGLAGRDLLGWAVSTSVWTDFPGALKAASSAYPGLGGLGALIATYDALLVVLAL